MGDHDDLKKELATISTSLHDLATNVTNLSAKFEDLATKVDRLSPLAPVASKLADLPEKVVTLQSSAFESTEQVRALNLALIRVESAQRDGKAHVEDDVDATLDSINGPPKQGPKPPPRPAPPFCPEPPPHDRFREEDDYTDTRFHPRARLETSWVDLEEFQAQFPMFQLEDELLLQGGRDVMWGLRYGRRNRKGQVADN